MENLPPELLVMILETIEPSALLNIRQVNLQWRNEVDQFFKRTKLWQRWCNADHIQPWVFEIIEMRFSTMIKNRRKKISQSMWKKIYLSYKVWRTCLTFPFVTSCFNFRPETFEGNEDITCIDVWGKFIAVGTSHGKMHIFAIGNIIEKIFTGSYSQIITNLKFWYTDTKELFAVVTLMNGNIEFWDVRSEQRVIGPYENEFSNIILSKRHQLFLADLHNIKECRWTVNGLSRGRELNLPLDLDLQLMGICTKYKEMMIVRGNSEFAMVSLAQIPRSQTRRIKLKEGSNALHELHHVRYPDSICHIATNDVVFLINDWYFYAAIRKPDQTYNWTTWALHDPLKDNVTSIYFHANIIFFGLKTGTLQLYHLNNIPHLHDIRLREIPIRSLNITTDPIIHLRLCEIDKKAFIIAATSAKLYIIKFFGNFHVHQII